MIGNKKPRADATGPTSIFLSPSASSNARDPISVSMPGADVGENRASVPGAAAREPRIVDHAGLRRSG
jgi:hypothetical protein